MPIDLVDELERDPGPKPDLSPEAIARRLEELRALFRLACSLHTAQLGPDSSSKRP